MTWCMQKRCHDFNKMHFFKPLISYITFSGLPQDSLLASPIILDLVILTELCQRVTVRPQGEKEFQSFHSVLALLAFLCKAPLVPPGTPVVNAFFRQRACIENIMRCEDCRIKSSCSCPFRRNPLVTSLLPLVFQSVPGPPSSELHAVGTQIAEKFPVRCDL